MSPRAAATPAKAGVRTVRVWDPLVRIVHWSIASLFLANLFLTESDGKVHEWFGYIVLGLIGVRVIWGIVGTRHARFSAFPPSLSAAKAHLAELVGAAKRYHPPALSHNPAGALMVYNLLLTSVALGVTGYMMGTNAFFGVEWVEDVHEVIANWGMISVFLHVGGVIVEQLRSRVNLVRAMITGDKEIPENS